MISRYENHMSLNTIVMVLKIKISRTIKASSLITEETGVVTWVTFCLIIYYMYSLSSIITITTTKN